MTKLLMIVCLAALKLIPEWFVTYKMVQKFHDALLANDDIFFFDKNFSKVTFFANEIDVFSVDFDKINLDDDNNFYEDNPKNITNIRLLT